MMPEYSDPPQRSPLRWVSRFAGGATLGAVLVTLPLSYSAPFSLALMQIAQAAFVMIGRGVIATIWEQALINAVMELLGKTGL